MKNFIQPGDVVTVTPPTCGLSSGDGIVIGNLFGIYATDADLTEEVGLSLAGVFRPMARSPRARRSGGAPRMPKSKTPRVPSSSRSHRREGGRNLLHDGARAFRPRRCRGRRPVERGHGTRQGNV
jgi:predicted RecA/RadA family phage recombinase